MNFVASDQLIDSTEVNQINENIQKLLKIAWKERGSLPGFFNSVYTLLANDFETNVLESVIKELKQLLDKQSAIEKFLNDFELPNVNSSLSKSINLLKRKKSILQFLSQFDFSIIQFENTLSIINKFGLDEIEKNPYLILENYIYDDQKNWNIDHSDSGLDIYNFDIALIPDPEFVSWYNDYDAQSPQRLRMAITKILRNEIKKSGSSCLSRDQIISELENYPLYYITKNLKLEKSLFFNYEKQPVFSEKFIINDDSFHGGEITYQLREIRKIESIIEQFIQKMISKHHDFDNEDSKTVQKLMNEESDTLQLHEIKQRKQMYENILKNGFFILSGKAGSGKTSSLVNLIKNFKNNNTTPIYVLTPTGKANLVIRERLKKLNLHNEVEIRVSTIHRFLYSAIREHYGTSSNKGQMDKYKMHLSRILEGKLDHFDEFTSIIKEFKLKPRILIIDETSMVDDILCATLFSIINPIFLKHLIMVGDEKQLPPIGLGIPFVDTIHNLHKNNLNQNYVRLETNLRFDPSAGLGLLSELFGQDKEPTFSEIKDVLESDDSTLSINYYKDDHELHSQLNAILFEISKINSSITEQFGKIIEQTDGIHLDSVQILAPRRVGAFGTGIINSSIIKEGKEEFSPKTKLICEENVYVSVKNQGRTFWQLGLSNGSMGYIKSDGTLFFEDIEELKEENDSVDTSQIESALPGEKSILKDETSIDLGYAITVHKAQGSDFEHVIFVLSDLGSFVLRELAYTGFTRARKKLHLLVNESLKDNLITLFSKVYDNSSVKNRKTMLFGYKKSIFRPHKLTKKDGTVIEMRSKIEYMIAKNLDESNLDFEYEPRDFFNQHRILPDFKINEKFYLEHLGNMQNSEYRRRWNKKLKIYKELDLLDNLITTEENQSFDFETSLKKMISDIKNDKLGNTQGGYSEHHYSI
jgi:exodeoxyribonuclease V alpha subunit